MTTALTLDDSYLVKKLSSPALSPDGAFVAYLQSEAIRGADATATNLWIVPTAGGSPHRLTRLKSRDAQPKWSPDGRYLAFCSDRPKELEFTHEDEWNKETTPEQHAQIWLFDMRWGGDARQITNCSEGVSHFNWSPDSASLVFSARDPSSEETQYLKDIRNTKKPSPIVINRVQHKYDGQGYLDNVRTHLFVIDVATREVRPLTEGPASEDHPVWSPDGQWIMFSSNRTGDADNNQRVDLWLIHPDGSDVSRITHGDVGAFSARFSPDSGQVAFLTSNAPENSYVLERLFVVNVTDATPVASFGTLGKGWSATGGIVPDDVIGDPVYHARVYPVPKRLTPMRLVSESFDGMIAGIASWTDDHIIVLAHHRAQLKLIRFALDGQWEVMAPRDRVGTLTEADANPHGIATLYNRPEHAQEIYHLANGNLQRLTHANRWLEDRQVGQHHWIQYPNHDGQIIEAVVLTPPGFEPGCDTAPLLVNIHGGPMSYDTARFEFDTQYWANRGYVVLMPNYRGSISYGEAFCQSIQGDWGPREHNDVMCGIDYLIEQGWTSENRLFCTGFSQGGIMTNWAIGHTNRFRAAVSEHGMWDYASAFGTDDCHLWWQDDLGVPWQNPDAYYRTSPMSGLSAIRTPLLITAGEQDWRCPLNQAEELYLALKKRGVPSELIIYPGEHHAITRPSRAIDRLKRIDGWLAKYGGIPVL